MVLLYSKGLGKFYNYFWGGNLHPHPPIRNLPYKKYPSKFYFTYSNLSGPRGFYVHMSNIKKSNTKIKHALTISVKISVFFINCKLRGFDWTLRVYFDVNLMQIFLHTNNIWVSTYGTQCRYKFKILSYIQIISRLARMVRSAFIYWEVSASTVIKDLLFLKRFINISVNGSTTLPSEIAPSSSLKHRC